MDDFTRKLITEWRKLNLPFADETFIVAVSGGADSIGLMLALDDLRSRGKLNLRLVVAHFDHDLRGAESAADAEFVRGLTTRFDCELVCGTPNSENKIKNQAGNLEQNARRSRYEFLAETAHNLHAYGVITAHTLNDQAETFLTNLMRGSGLAGLSGMQTIRNLESKVQNFELVESEISKSKSQIRLVRPLLNWAKREDTENYCRRRQVEFRYDSMNEDLAFNRVRIRKILLPLLHDFNPKIIETLAQTANLLRESAEQQSLDIKYSAETVALENEIAENKNEPSSLSVKSLTDIFPAVRRSILRNWLKENRGNLRRLELKHIEAVEKLIFSRKSGRVVELPDGASVVKNRGKLHFQKSKVDK